MLVRLSTYLKEVRANERSTALALSLGARNRSLEAEVHRLTDAILAMQKEGFVVHPRATDPQWPEGKYVMDEGGEPPAPPPEPEDVALDRSLRSQVEASLNGRH